MSADPITAARKDNHFVVPVIVVRNTIVQCASVDPRIQETEDGKKNENFEGFQGPWVLPREFLTLGIVVSQQEQRHRLPGIEEGPLQQFPGYIRSKPYC